MSENYPRYTRAKATVTDWQAVKALSTEKNTWICLSERDKFLLAVGLVPLRWKTRYINVDNDLQLPDMIDSIEEYLNMSESCCDAIAQCIENSETVQDAIDNTTNNNYYGDNTTPLENGIPALDDCGNDKVFGAVTELVRYVNRAIEDAFEQIELATNSVELIAEWFDNVSIIAIVPATFSDLFVFIQDTLGEAYLSGYTVGLEDDMRCDYFCLFNEDCTLTVQMLFEYHYRKVTANPFPTNVFELIEELNTFSTVGTLAVHISYAIAYGFLWLGDLLGDLLPFLTLPTMRNIQIPLALGANNPDPDWSILCDPCGAEWCEIFDFTINNGGFTADSVDAGNAGTWTASGWIDGQHRIGTRYYRGIRITRSFASSTVTSIEFEVSYIKGTSDNPTIPALAIRDEFGDLEVILYQDAVSGLQTISWSGNKVITEVSFLVICSAQNAPTYDGGATIKNAEVCGEGSNPF